MPSKTEKQHRAMEAAAHGHSTLGIPQSVGQDFVAADKGKGKAEGGVMEHDDHFRVSGPHGEYRIAKRGLHPATVKMIQKMATGGVVKMKNGGDPKKAEEEQDDETESVPDDTSVLGPAGTESYRSAFPNAPAISAGNPDGVIPVAPPLLAGTPPPDKDKLQGPIPPVVSPAGAEVRGQSAVNNLLETGPAPVQRGLVDKQPTPGTPGAPPQPEQKPAGAGGPELQKHVSMTYHSATERPDWQEAEGERRAAVDQQAAAQAKYAQQVSESEDQRQKTLTEARVYGQLKKAELDRAGDKLRQDILTNKIDPNHYWQEKGTGGKIMGAIGILFSGLGAGMQAAGGHAAPNMAMQIIQNNIDRDIDAQKANLGTKKSMLNDIYRQTNDLRLAEAETRLYANEMVHSQGVKLAASLNSDTAKAKAAELLAISRQRIEEDRTRVADMSAASWVNAKNADITQANQVAMMQAKAAAKGAAGISDRVTATSIGAIKQYGKLLEEAEKPANVPGFANVVKSDFTLGGRAREHAAGMLDSMAGEKGKIQTGGIPGEKEMEQIRTTQPRKFGTLGAGKAWLNHLDEQWEWLEGQAQGQNKAFRDAGKAGVIPHPEWEPGGEMYRRRRQRAAMEGKTP